MTLKGVREEMISEWRACPSTTSGMALRLEGLVSGSDPHTTSWEMCPRLYTTSQRSVVDLQPNQDQSIPHGIHS